MRYEWITCPECYETFDIGLGQKRNIYQEGKRIVRCPECKKSFVLITEIKCMFNTKKLKRREAGRRVQKSYVMRL